MILYNERSTKEPERGEGPERKTKTSHEDYMKPSDHDNVEGVQKVLKREDKEATN